LKQKRRPPFFEAAALSIWQAQSTDFKQISKFCQSHFEKGIIDFEKGEGARALPKAF